MGKRYKLFIFNNIILFKKNVNKRKETYNNFK